MGFWKRHGRLIGWGLLAGGLALGGCAGGDETTESPPRRGRPALASGEKAIEAQEQATADRVRENKPPTARCDISPKQAWADLTLVVLDASRCTDDWNVGRELLKRWDFDGDGTWDTHLSRSPRIGHTYTAPGTVRPRLMVQDAGGLTDTLIAPPLLIHPADPPPDFALRDVNRHSPTYGDTLRLSEQHGHPVLVWFALPST